MEKTVNQKIISGDVLRYKKNKLAAAFALLGLAFNCLYYTVLYCMSERTFYTNLIGLSVLVNLFVLLAAFLSSEGVKNYKKHFAVLLLILAAIQIIRIFIYPLKVLEVEVPEGKTFYEITGANYFGANLTASATTTIMIVYLAASAAFFVLAAVWGYVVAVRLEKFNAALESGEINVDATLKAMEREEAAADSADASGEVR